MSSPARQIPECLPASIVLERLLVSMPEDRVSLGWLHGELHEHSFELLAFVMALIGVLPGASIFVGLLMAFPAMGMIFSSARPLPSVVAQRSIPARQASVVLGRAISLLKSWEVLGRPMRPRDWTPIRPVVGILSLVLGLTLLVPVPLSNVPPALAIAGLSLASFEGNLFLLILSAAGAAASLAFTCLTLVAATHAFASLWL